MTVVVVGDLARHAMRCQILVLSLQRSFELASTTTVRIWCGSFRFANVSVFWPSATSASL